jgi:hypothetical protein
MKDTNLNQKWTEPKKSRSKIFAAGLTAALVCGLAVPIFRAVASYDDSDDDGCPGGSIEGSEYLQAKVALMPTDAAPAGAGGRAELEVKNRNGVVRTRLEVKTYGLAAGDYLLSAVRKSDGTAVELGMINIDVWGDDYDSHDESGKSGPDDDDEGYSHDDDGDDDSDHNGSSKKNHKSGILASETEVDLPADLDPLDVAQIIVADDSGAALLVGDLVDVAPASSLSYKANVKLYGAEAAPLATGKAMASTSGKKGKRSDRFTLVASRLPANTAFNVMVNGQSVTTATSNKKGRLMVKKLPSNNLMISSLRLVDPQGRVAAKARF